MRLSIAVCARLSLVTWTYITVLRFWKHRNSTSALMESWYRSEPISFMDYFHIKFVLAGFRYMNLWYLSKCYGRFTQFRLFPLDLIPWSNWNWVRLPRDGVTVLLPHWENWDPISPLSFDRASKMVGNSYFNFQSASILCHQVFNFLFSGYMNSLLC